MNPYFNSLNGWGGGFIAFWPSQGITGIRIPGIEFTLPERQLHYDIFL